MTELKAVAERRHHKRAVSISVADASKRPPPSTAHERRLIREAELRIERLNGVGRTTLRRWMKDEGFPAAIRLSERILAWDLSEVDEWIASRPRMTDLLILLCHTWSLVDD